MKRVLGMEEEQEDWIAACVGLASVGHCFSE